MYRNCYSVFDVVWLHFIYFQLRVRNKGLLLDLCSSKAVSITWRYNDLSYYRVSLMNNYSRNSLARPGLLEYGLVNTGSDNARHATIYSYVLYMLLSPVLYKEHISILPRVAHCRFPSEQAL